MGSYKVVFEYEAEADDELTLQVGDIVTNAVPEPEVDGWLRGSLNGKTGLFPDNFVEQIETKSAPPPKPAPPKPAPPKVTPPPPTPLATEKEPPKKQVKCMFEHVPEQDDELHIAEGDIITILDDSDPDWWKGELKGRVGIFPSNFVEQYTGSSKPALPSDEEESKQESRLISAKKIHGVGLGNIFAGGEIKLRKTGGLLQKKEPVAAAEPPHAQLRHSLKPSQMEKPAATTPSAKQDDAEYCKALFEYVPQQDDELLLKPGDVIRIISKEAEDGWWEGILNGKQGWFPDNFVEITQGPESKPDKTSRSALRPPPKSVSRTGSISAPQPRSRTESLKLQQKPELKNISSTDNSKKKLELHVEDPKPSLPSKPGPAVPQKKPNKPPPSLKPKTVPKPAAHAAPQGKQDDAHTVKQGLPKSPSSVPAGSKDSSACSSMTSFIQKKENEAASHTDVPKLQALQNTQHSGESISSAQISELSSTVDSLRKTVDFLKKKMDLLGSELDQERLEHSKLKLEYERRIKDLEIKVGL
eukprot:gene2369-8069_t